MLPKWERRLYVTVHVSVVMYIVYCVYIASNNYDGLLNVYDFETGWSIIPREKDMSNYEWYFFYNFFWFLGPWYVAYIAVDWILRHHVSLPHRRHGCLLFSLVLLTYILGWKSLVLLCTHTVIMFLTSFLQSTIAVWIISVTLISTLNMEFFVSLMRDLNPDDNDGKAYYVLMFTLALVHLRYTSFSLEHVQYLTKSTKDIVGTEETEDIQSEHMDTEKTEFLQSENMYMEIRKEEAVQEKNSQFMKFSLLDALFYIFYFPLIFTGPIITYDEFSKQMNETAQKPIDRDKAITIGLQAVRMILWAFFNELILHYLYFNALQHNISVIEDMDLWTLAGIGYCQGQFFMTKYTVMFGLPSAVARICGIEPPLGPKCVAHIYTYSEMWKYFDRGMYSFLKRYIYIPLGGSKGNFIQKLMYSLACFVFVYIWHGIEYYIFLWTLFNFIGITLEVLGEWVDRQEFVERFQRRMPSFYLRIKCLIIVPLFMMSAFTAFCFFGGSKIGYMFYLKFVLQGWINSWLTVIFILYCCIQSSMEIHRCQRQKDKKS